MGVDSRGYDPVLEKERAAVGTLLSLGRRLEDTLEKLRTRKGVDKIGVQRDDLTDYELSMSLRELTRPLTDGSEFLGSFDGKQKSALEVAAKLVRDAWETMSREETYFASADPTPEEMEKLRQRGELNKKIEAAKTIIDLVWELQPRKTHADFGDR